LLVAEHKTDLVADLCPRVVVLENGAMVADGPAATVFADPRLLEWGVDPPSAVRLAQAAAARGLDPAVVAA
ncbi:MAG: ABC transporter ATP-binding protein, partial [Chloroflexota bacterium]